ncbi:lmo0937 family membrane protein [Candidatus Kaiserbacteria bacterium]|nr:lmo0937 family membrane protein [Candidatus Kaiserbacteria bacterium]
MLSTIASILLVLWIFGVVGVFYIGGFVHLFLLAAAIVAGIRISQEYSVNMNELVQLSFDIAKERTSALLSRSREMLYHRSLIWTGRSRSMAKRMSSLQASSGALRQYIEEKTSISALEKNASSRGT